MGRLSGVVPDAMQFCYELVTAGTPLAAPPWRSSRRPGGPTAAPAAIDFELADLILLCPCGSADVELTAGKELQVISVELVAEPCA